jgi:hypothetical protein
LPAALSDVVGHERGRQPIHTLVAEALGPNERARPVGELAGPRGISISAVAGNVIRSDLCMDPSFTFSRSGLEVV